MSQQQCDATVMQHRSCLVCMSLLLGLFIKCIIQDALNFVLQRSRQLKYYCWMWYGCVVEAESPLSSKHWNCVALESVLTALKPCKQYKLLISRATRMLMLESIDLFPFWLFTPHSPASNFYVVVTPVQVLGYRYLNFSVFTYYVLTVVWSVERIEYNPFSNRKNLAVKHVIGDGSSIGLLFLSTVFYICM